VSGKRRGFASQEDRRQTQALKNRGGISFGKAKKLKLTTKYYWHRLIGTSLGWFAWSGSPFTTTSFSLQRILYNLGITPGWSSGIINQADRR
jgi:hypothetical protein